MNLLNLIFVKTRTLDSFNRNTRIIATLIYIKHNFNEQKT